MVRGLMTEREWGFFAPFVVATGGKSGRPPSDNRRVLDGVFWIARTGAQWRDLHEHFGKWSSVYRQFRRWTLAGVWELMLAALNDGGGLHSVQMIDSTIIRRRIASLGSCPRTHRPRRCRRGRQCAGARARSATARWGCHARVSGPAPANWVDLARNCWNSGGGRSEGTSPSTTCAKS